MCRALPGPLDGRRYDVQREQVVAALAELRGEHTDRATGLEGTGEPLARQRRQRQRPLAALVPPVGEPPRVVAALGVELLEEGSGQALDPVAAVLRPPQGRWRGGPEEHLDVPAEVGQDVLAQHHLIAGGGESGSTWERWTAMASPLRARVAAGRGSASAASHGRRSSPGAAQCQAQIGYSSSWAPWLEATSAATRARRVVVGVGVPAPGRDEPARAGQQRPAAHACSSARCSRRCPSGRPSRCTRAPGASWWTAWVTSSARQRASDSAEWVGDPGCEPSPVVATTTSTVAPAVGSDREQAGGSEGLVVGVGGQQDEVRVALRPPRRRRPAVAGRAGRPSPASPARGPRVGGVEDGARRGGGGVGAGCRVHHGRSSTARPSAATSRSAWCWRR